MAACVAKCESEYISAHLYDCGRSTACIAGNLEGAANVQALAIALLSRWSLGALTSADDAVRETALRSFLPVLASAAGRLGAESGQHVLQSIWEQCRWACITTIANKGMLYYM